MNGADCAVVTAQNDDRIPTDLNGEVVTGRRQFALMANKQPFPVIDMFHVELMESHVAIKLLVKREPFASHT